MRAESLLVLSERMGDEKTLPKESVWSAIQVTFWLIQTLQGFLIASYWMKYCIAKAGVVNDIAQSAASQVLLTLSAKI